MSTERDELARIIASSHTNAAVDAILAAGYRKPQQVTTVEELEALPAWSIVRVNGICFQRSRLDYCCWAAMTGLESYSSAALAQRPGPFTVLHVGGAE
jgi:hypothetical protein